MEARQVPPDILPNDISNLIMEVLIKEGVDTSKLKPEIEEIIEVAYSILALKSFRAGYRKGIKIATCPYHKFEDE